MGGTVLCLAAIAFGVDVGWRALPEGGTEYIIQIEPQLLEMLRTGEDLVSDIPPNLRGVRSYRITVGTEELPREEGVVVHEADPSASPGSQSLPAAGVPPLANTVITAAQPLMPGMRRPEFPPSEAPGTLSPPADSRPLPEFGRRTPPFVKQEAAEPNPPRPSTQEDTVEPEQAEPGRAWLPWTLALALFGSLGGTVYVGWIAWDYRRQYQALLGELTAGGGQVAEDEAAGV